MIILSRSVRRLQAWQIPQVATTMIYLHAFNIYI
jgi:hypothetical protein